MKSLKDTTLQIRKYSHLLILQENSRHIKLLDSVLNDKAFLDYDSL